MEPARQMPRTLRVETLRVLAEVNHQARIGQPGVAVRGLRKGVGGQPASVRCSYVLAKLAKEFN